jgi:hypothetical protein
MSIRAYRVIEVKRTDERFNLYHDEGVFDWLQANTDFTSRLNEDCCGIGDIAVTDLKQMIKDLKLDKEVVERIKEEIKWAEKEGDEYITYECF